MYQNRFVISYFRPVKKPPMNRHLTYRPQTAHIPADSLLGNPCDSRDPRRSMNPLTGIWPACATVPGYRYASPDGEGCPATIVHYSLCIVQRGPCICNATTLYDWSIMVSSLNSFNMKRFFVIYTLACCFAMGAKAQNDTDFHQPDSIYEWKDSMS